ncbi:MAG: hypothetical protein KKC46_03065 [Proteobacteria bacterium]|nr:hypothetical protein [Pseudomonadota bacterium]
MENQTDKLEIRSKFNEILKQHITKLIGVYDEIFDLSFTLKQIACLILLREQIGGQSDNFPVYIEKYFKETLFNEISELGLETDDELDKIFEELIQKKYLQINEDNTICVNKLTYSITNLLDLIYPSMSGMNFPAYIIQTMDEVISGRKELAHALDQFGQTLQLHGVMVKKQDSKTKQQKSDSLISDSKIIKPKKTETHSKKQFFSAKNKIETNNESNIIKSGNLIKPFFSPFSESKITPAFEKKEEIIIEETSFIDKEITKQAINNSEENEEVINITEVAEKTDKNELNACDDNISICSDTENTVEPDSENDKIQNDELLINKEQIITAKIHDNADKKDILPGVLETEKYEEEINPGLINEDNIVENQIAAFEEELAMQCPVCNNGKVISNKTIKNKVYFRCSNKQCSFISWGKPYYLSCPKCGNTFLIESTLSNGKAVLRCPRATCRYTRAIPGEEAEGLVEQKASIIDLADQKTKTTRLPVKRAVRKRVVRRRK